MGLYFLVVLWIFQSAGRLYFAVLGTPRGMSQFLDVPVTYEISFLLFTMFLSLGVLGFIAVLSFWKSLKGGFWMTVLVSLATIAFDIWGMTIQGSAAIGFIVPVISLTYLLYKNPRFLHA